MASRVSQITQRSVQRIIYRTITPNLDKWPNSGELKTLVNEQSVVQSIKNLVSTYNTERYYHPDIGSQLARGLFEFADEYSADLVKDQLLNTIRNYEQRAANPQVAVSAAPENNAFYVDIQFTLAVTGAIVAVPTIILRVR